MLLGGGLALLVINGWLAGRTLRVEERLVDLVDALPSWTDELFGWAYGLAGLFVLWLLIAALARKRPRWDIARDLAAAGLGALVVALVVVRLVDGEWPIVLPELDRAEPAALFPVVRVGVVSAMVAVAGVHVSRIYRRLGWSFVVLVAVSGLGLGLGLPTDALGGVGLGLAAAGGVLLLFGSPSAYPDRSRVAADLAALGVTVGDLRPANEQTWGVRTFTATGGDGRALVVKVYGPDARDAQLLAKAWRLLWYRDVGFSVTASRLQQVEHEALVTLLAAKAEVRCPAVIAAAVSQEDAVLVLADRGVPLSELEDDALSDELLIATWREVAGLHAAGISHGSLRIENIRVEGDAPLLASFGTGSMSPQPATIATDVVELLVSQADRVGAERAVAAALAGLGGERLAAAIPYMQVPALSTASRRVVDDAKDVVEAVKAAVVAATGVEPPEPAKVRRVSPRDLVFTGLMVLAAYFLIHQLAGLDLAAIWDSMKTAELGWAVIAFLAAQLILFPNATGMMAAVDAAIPLRPTIILQSAIQFIGLAVPSSAGRIATNVAFLTKYGVTPVTAITQGALDSFTGFLVQVAILGAALLFGDLSFGLGGDFDFDWALILGIAFAVIAAGVLVVFLIESLRTRIVSVAKEAWAALAGLLQEPRRATLLFGSNFGSQLALGLAMWFTVRAFDASIPLATALVIVVGAVLLGGVAPTPGGVGVQEAVLAAGLVSAGLDQDTSFAIAITYRLFTFFLPPIWGFFSLRWLEKQGYL